MRGTRGDGKGHTCRVAEVICEVKQVPRFARNDSYDSRSAKKQRPASEGGPYNSIIIVGFAFAPRQDFARATGVANEKPWRGRGLRVLAHR